MEPGSRSSGFAGREGRVREGVYCYHRRPMHRFSNRRGQGRRCRPHEGYSIPPPAHVAYHDEGSEVQHVCTPKFLRQMSSGTAKAAAGTIAKTKQISGGSSPSSPRRSAQRRLSWPDLVARYPDSKYAKRTAVRTRCVELGRVGTARRRTAVTLSFSLTICAHIWRIIFGGICPHRIGTDS